MYKSSYILTIIIAYLYDNQLIGTLESIYIYIRNIL